MESESTLIMVSEEHGTRYTEDVARVGRDR
jgi:hypothetical protein